MPGTYKENIWVEDVGHSGWFPVVWWAIPSGVNCTKAHAKAHIASGKPINIFLILNIGWINFLAWNYKNIFEFLFLPKCAGIPNVPVWGSQNCESGELRHRYFKTISQFILAASRHCFVSIFEVFYQQYPGEQAWTKLGKGVLLLPKANGQSMPGTCYNIETNQNGWFQQLISGSIPVGWWTIASYL